MAMTQRRRASDELRAARTTELAPFFLYMDDVGLKRNRVAARMGISASRFWNYEHGWHPMPEHLKFKLFEALGKPKQLEHIIQEARPPPAA